MELKMLKSEQSIKAFVHPHCVRFFFIFNVKGHGGSKGVRSVEDPFE